MTLQLMRAQITNLIMRKHNFKLSAVQKSQNSSTVLYNLIKTDFAQYFCLCGNVCLQESRGWQAMQSALIVILA